VVKAALQKGQTQYIPAPMNFRIEVFMFVSNDCERIGKWEETKLGVCVPHPPFSRGSHSENICCGCFNR
jgi:hypothetical protein